MREIQLTQGQVAIVDDDDYDMVVAVGKWQAHKKLRGCGSAYYAIHHYGKGKRKNKRILMHRLIIEASSEQQVDHRDGNGLNNRRDNLRLATGSNNSHNRPSVGGVSRYKGVGWDKRYEKWRARIAVNNVRRSLGYFQNEELAARAYDEAAAHFHGEFARLNFPEQ